MSAVAIQKPKVLVRPMPATWWLQKRAYLVFMLRELSSVFVALVCVGLVLLVQAVNQGPAAYHAFLEGLAAPPALALSGVALAFLLLHSVTFFMLTGKVIVVQIGENRVPSSLIAAAHFAMWFVVSGAIVWLVTR